MTFFETIGKIIERYSSFFAQGVVNTLIIAAFSVLLGTILGTLMAPMRMGKILPLKWLAAVPASTWRWCAVAGTLATGLTFRFT